VTGDGLLSNIGQTSKETIAMEMDYCRTRMMVYLISRSPPAPSWLCFSTCRFHLKKDDKMPLLYAERKEEIQYSLAGLD
jgi:hypothetical protein